MLPSAFKVVAKFPRRKSSRILSYFCGGNPATLCLKCVIVHKTLFSSSFHYKNTAIEVPHFHSENLAEFRVWCIVVHRQGFMPVYTTRANMLVLRRARAPQSIKHIGA